jgi:hypothetical protein
MAKSWKRLTKNGATPHKFVPTPYHPEYHRVIEKSDRNLTVTSRSAANYPEQPSLCHSTGKGEQWWWIQWKTHSSAH